MEDITDRYERVSIDDDEEAGLVIEQPEESDVPTSMQWCLVGRFLTDRMINRHSMKNTLAAIWRLVRGVLIKDLQPNLFLFQFFHELDLVGVLNGSPWTFDRHLFIIRRLEPSVDPKRVQLIAADFWVHIYDLPCGLLSEKVIRDIGNFIGTYVEADPKNFDGIGRYP